MLYLKLFADFFKVSCFTFGGAYGAVPLIRDMVLSNNWLSEERFAASRVRQRRDLSGRGRAAVRAELRALGVDEAVSSAALDEEYDEAREATLAEALADRALTALAADRERKD